MWCGLSPFADGTFRWYQSLGRQAKLLRKYRGLIGRVAPPVGRAIFASTSISDVPGCSRANHAPATGRVSVAFLTTSSPTIPGAAAVDPNSRLLRLTDQERLMRFCSSHLLSS